jgi:hypothetical protein
MNTKPLIKLACQKVFGDASGLIDMLATHFPTAGLRKVAHNAPLLVHACLDPCFLSRMQSHDAARPGLR